MSAYGHIYKRTVELTVTDDRTVHQCHFEVEISIFVEKTE